MIDRLTHRPLGHINTGHAMPDYQVGAWAVISGTNTAKIHTSHNVSSITDNASGDFTFTLQRAFASASAFAVFGSFWNSTANARRGHYLQDWNNRESTTTVRLVHSDVVAGAVDHDPFAMVCVGRF